VGIRGVNLDEIEEMFAHESAIALKLLGSHRKVLAQVEHHDVLEREPFFAMQPNQFGKHAGRSRAGGKADYAAPTDRRTSGDQVNDLARDRDVYVVCASEDLGGNALRRSRRFGETWKANPGRPSAVVRGMPTTILRAGEALSNSLPMPPAELPNQLPQRLRPS